MLGDGAGRGAVAGSTLLGDRAGDAADGGVAGRDHHPDDADGHEPGQGIDALPVEKGGKDQRHEGLQELDLGHAGDAADG